jgi:Yip1 domain
MTAPAPAERPPSVWEDLLEIFYAPTAVFERRRETPAFAIALIVFVVLIVGLSFAFRGLMEPIFDIEFKRGMAQAMKKNPQITPEMMEKGKAFAKQFLVFGVAFYGLLTPPILAIILWFVGKVVDSKAQIGQMMMVATYSMFPKVLDTILAAVQMLVLPDSSIHGRYSLSLGVGRFLDPDSASPMLLAIVGRLDVFTLWVTFLLGVGLAVMGRIPKARAFAAAAVMWLVGALPGIWGALRAG